MAKKKTKSKEELRDECTIPGPVSPAALNQSTLKRSEHDEPAIKEYVEWQTHGEEVVYLEKVATEPLFDRKLDAWDVHTNKGRYWVITNPTNLYSQQLFPSLDYTLSFHVGVTTRMMAMRKVTVEDEQQDRLAVAWRRWTQAAEALDRADEAEEFQAVGMRCRESLVALIRAVASDTMVPSGQDVPKAADFIHWSELIANSIAKGASAEEIRGYLKSISKSTWQLVNWLTHASNAVRFDGIMAVDATEHVLASFGAALIRHERGIPDRCPRCSSYRVTTTYRPDLDIDPPYIPFCESCGWTNVPDDRVPINEKDAQPLVAATPKEAAATRVAKKAAK